MCIIILGAPNPLFASDDMNGLSRQDTLPAEDPSWLYSQVRGPGQPAPIPPRSEPVLYIPRANDNLYEDMAADLPHSSTDVSEPIVVTRGIPSLFLILSQCSFVLLQHVAQI